MTTILTAVTEYTKLFKGTTVLMKRIIDLRMILLFSIIRTSQEINYLN